MTRLKTNGTEQQAGHKIHDTAGCSTRRFCRVLTTSLFDFTRKLARSSPKFGLDTTSDLPPRSCCHHRRSISGPEAGSRRIPEICSTLQCEGRPSSSVHHRGRMSTAALFSSLKPQWRKTALIGAQTHDKIRTAGLANEARLSFAAASEVFGRRRPDRDVPGKFRYTASQRTVGCTDALLSFAQVERDDPLALVGEADLRPPLQDK